MHGVLFRLTIPTLLFHIFADIKKIYYGRRNDRLRIV